MAAIDELKELHDKGGCPCSVTDPDGKPVELDVYKRQAYTYVGLVLFLTGANVGFMPAGNYLGQVLTGQSYRCLLYTSVRITWLVVIAVLPVLGVPLFWYTKADISHNALKKRLMDLEMCIRDSH